MWWRGLGVVTGDGFVEYDGLIVGLLERDRAEQPHEATRARESEGCESSNRKCRLSDSLLRMQLFRTYSISVGIWCPPITTGISGSVRSWNGPEQ
jgi:hypothetical protein